MDNTNQNSIALQVPHILPCVCLVCLSLMFALMPPLFHIKLGLHIAMHQYWWPTNQLTKKQNVIWEKLSSIWMKILNDFACNLNWTHILKFNSNTLKSNSMNYNWIKIPLKQKMRCTSLENGNEMHIGEEGIENLLMNLVVEKQLLKRHKSKKTSYPTSRSGLCIMFV
jgi:hypothetical protein